MKRFLARLILALLAAAAAAPALAANCSGFTYTLTNGQTADATQVMSNFNTLMSCANGNLAKNGANNDITSLSALSTPLSIAQGGTGQSTSIFAGNNTWSGTNAFGTISFTGITLNLTGSGVTGSASLTGTGTVSLSTTPSLQYAVFQNQQTSGTYSGGGVSNEALSGLSSTYQTLNTSVANTITGASLASNQITLPAGTYSLAAVVPVYSVSTAGVVRCRLRNVTDSATLLAGSDNYLVATGGNAESLSGVFTLSGTKAVGLQCSGSGGTAGVGGGVVSSGEAEVYESVSLLKIG